MAKEFHHIKEKTQNRLQGWTAQSRSNAKKATLIKSMTQAIPIYAMSSFLIPKGITSDLDSIIRRFWWESKPKSSGFLALKSWQKICKPKELGGLRFRRFHEFNIALISKLSWHIAHDDNDIWSSVLKAKYLKGKSIFEHKISKNSSRVWHGIVEGIS